MKSILFALYAVFFNFFKLFGVRKNSVVLISMHNASFNDSLGYMKKEAEKRGYQTKMITRKDLEIVKDKGAKEFFSSLRNALRFFTVGAHNVARAKYIFLNDNFMPMAYAKPSKNTVVVQLWHAQGAFKKFGMDIEVSKKIRKREKKANSRLTFVVCSSALIESIYAQAFGVDNSKVLPLGSPCTDYYFENHNIELLRKSFDEQYPNCENKKLLLYAPTFREDKVKDKELLKAFDISQVQKALGDDYAVLLRLHPQIHNSTGIDISGAIDVTDFENVKELCLLCDVLVTDYSSICMDFSVQKKPMIFYAFDLKDYEQSRDFYFDYESYVPGKVAKTMPELVEILENKDFDEHKNGGFKYFNFGSIDGTASDKVAKAIFPI
ncbi:MAG: CDP-glycerol glycerophosphotransferase family protein [Acutalibacteraceae bacterium]|jgi:CDP-ribitol ribitolphosphotransferase|nr:hypothetical protein [Clostridiales bacterium]